VLGSLNGRLLSSVPPLDSLVRLIEEKLARVRSGRKLYPTVLRDHLTSALAVRHATDYGKKDAPMQVSGAQVKISLDLLPCRTSPPVAPPKPPGREWKSASANSSRILPHHGTAISYNRARTNICGVKVVYRILVYNGGAGGLAR
jgi:hypothetical protein